MKIKLDENLPSTLAQSLGSLGHDVETVFDEALSGEDDDHLWQAVQKEGRFLITQDLDFSDIRKFSPGTHGGLLLVRLRNPGRRALTKLVSSVFASQDAEDWSGCFAVLTASKLRVIRKK